MKLKVDSEKQLALKVYERAKRIHEDSKSQIKRSRSRKKSEASNREKQDGNVYDRLFNDVRERSKKRLGYEIDNSSKHYESVGNISLSSLSKQDGKERRINNITNESVHIPSINKNSKRMITPKRSTNTSVNSALYKDAEVRREKRNTERKRSHSKEKEEMEKRRKGTLNTSKKMLIKKYLIEFDEIALKLGISEEPESQVHYTQFLSLMQHMGFVPEDSELELDKLKMIWNIIQDQNSNDDIGHYCRKHSLKVILAAVCGFDSRWMFKDYTKGQNVDQKAPKRSVIDLHSNETCPIKLDIGCFIEGLLFLNHREEADYIHRIFSCLYNNRLLQKERMLKNQRKIELSDRESGLFKPKINQSYENQSPKEKVKVEERLLHKHKEYQEKKKQKEIKIKLEQEKECTFIPNLEKGGKEIQINYASKSNDGDNSDHETPYDKFIDKEISKKLRENRKEIAIKTTKGFTPPFEMAKNLNKTPQFRYKKSFDYEKEPDKLDITDNSQQQEVIFEQQNNPIVSNDYNNDSFQQKHQPELNEYKEEIVIDKSDKPIHDDEQSGSENNEEQKESPIKSDLDDGEGEDVNFPILFLDVNLGKDRVERLVVYDGDDPIQVANEFCTKNNLDERKRRKLAKVIKKQLDSLLTRIDEDEDEEDSRS